MKILTRLLSIFALPAAILVPTVASADSTHYTYTVSDGKATITDYTGPGGDIISPETLGGYAVTIEAATRFGTSAWTPSLLPQVLHPVKIEMLSLTPFLCVFFDLRGPEMKPDPFFDLTPFLTPFS